MLGNTNLAPFSLVFGQPSADAFEKLALARIAASLAMNLNFGNQGSTGVLLEPLLSNVLRAESAGTFGSTTTNCRNFILVVKVDDAGIKLWHDNLEKIFGRAGEEFSTNGFDGWRWKTKALVPIWIIRANDWLIFGLGDEFVPMQKDCLDQIRHQGRPVPPLKDKWLEADVDMERSADCFPEVFHYLKPARINLNVTTQGNKLRVAAGMSYAQAFDWSGAELKPPKDLVKGSLVSFTAAQDVAAFCALSPAFSQLDGNPLTNQFFAWAASGFPFLSYIVWPQDDAANVLKKLSTKATREFNASLKNFNGTELHWLPHQERLVLANLRVILPSLQILQDKSGPFLGIMMFALAPTGPQAPDELWRQIKGRSNLVYYDWESTGLRLQQWELLGRMLLTRRHKSSASIMKTQKIETKFISDLASLTGNTVTEITRTSPTELSVLRTGPIGLTGIELFLFADWVGNLAVPGDNPRPTSP